jgi:citrate synthase
MAEKSEKSSGVSVGLAGVVIAESTISLVDGENGRLYYRGYSIEDLAKNCSFEEVTYLLLYEKLPNRKELDAFTKELKRRRVLPEHVVKMMKSFAKGMTTMEALRTTVSALAAGDPDASKVSYDGHIRNGVGLIAKFPTIVAYHYRMKQGKSVVPPNPKLGFAANFLYMLSGKVPDEVSVRAMDMDFVLHAEHSFNASTFGVRVTVSTLSDMHSAMTTGIGVLKGPLHGGAAQEVMHMLREIKSPKNARKYALDALANHKVIMGYGHRVYKVYDPRARVLKKTATELSVKKHNTTYMQIADVLEDVMAKEKNIYPNVDFYSSIVYHNLGLPLELDTPIFAIARSSGWVAHALAQYQNNKLIRPLDRYVGPIGLKFIPIEKRP